MTVLISAITTSSLIFVIFKLFERFGIDTFQAIVFNYITAFTCGLLFFGGNWEASSFGEGNWIYFALLCSGLFFSLFFVMGKSSQINGVASTSVAVKMSMAVSLLLMIFGYSENVSILKALGILLAFAGVYFVASPSKKDNSTKTVLWMLLFLFIGSGILDFLLNFAQKHILDGIPPTLFASVAFGLSGIIGLSILSYRLIIKKSSFHLKNALAGIILGIPNFFSIYFLLESYIKMQNENQWEDSQVLAVINVSVVLLSSALGLSLFREKATVKKIIGLILSVLAIGVLTYSSMK